MHVHSCKLLLMRACARRAYCIMRNGSERLRKAVLREERLSNAQGRGPCKENAGHAPQMMIFWERGIVQLWNWREIGALAEALLWEKGASKLYIAISYSLLFRIRRRGNTKKSSYSWPQNTQLLVPDTLPDNIANLVYKVSEFGVFPAASYWISSRGTKIFVSGKMGKIVPERLPVAILKYIYRGRE